MKNSGNAATMSEDCALIEMFFDLEAELDKGICHDEVAYQSNGREQGFFQ